MSINGRIKFFEKSSILFKDGTTATATTSNDSAKLTLDVNKYTAWISAGSSDGDTQEIIETPSEAKVIDRLFLVGMNFKTFNVMYFNGGLWKDFSSVIGIDGSSSTINETAFSRSTAYYEFDQVSAEKIRIQVSHTQVADEEKRLVFCIATTEIATLEQYPRFLRPRSSNNSKNDQNLNGRRIIDKSIQSFQFTLGFRNYPSLADYNLMNLLFDKQETFQVWLCGGVCDTPDVRFPLRGFGIDDIFNVQTESDFFPSFTNSIYVGPWNANVRIAETLPS